MADIKNLLLRFWTGLLYMEKIVHCILPNLSRILDTGTSEPKLKKVYRTFYTKMLKFQYKFLKVPSGSVHILLKRSVEFIAKVKKRAEILLTTFL